LFDGRVLISDPRERRVVVADMATGRIAQVGRAGRGPLEYTSASRLRRLSGDSTLLIYSSRRWVFFHGSRVVHTLPPDAPVVRAAGGFELDADTLGSVLVRIPRVVRRPAGDVRWSDSIAVVHFRRVGTVRIDTIAYLREAFPAKVPPFQREALLAAPDGRLLVRRTVTASRPEGRYDIVDRAGRLMGHVVLPPDERIIGFGLRSVYVVWRDAEGFERLRRHPWP